MTLKMKKKIEKEMETKLICSAESVMDAVEQLMEVAKVLLDLRKMSKNINTKNKLRLWPVISNNNGIKRYIKGKKYHFVDILQNQCSLKLICSDFFGININLKFLV